MHSVKLPYDGRLVATAIALALAVAMPLPALLAREAYVEMTHEVKISGFAFVPQNLTVNLGDTIVWNNTDPVIHTLWFVFIANGSTYHLSNPIIPGATWNYTFNDAPELQYYSFEMLWITGFINVTAGIHDVAVTEAVTSKTGCQPAETVGQGYPIDINVTVENEGNFTETFNVTINANFTEAGRQSATLISGENQILMFTWNTLGWAKGNYSITVTATPVPAETDTFDNTMFYGWVFVTIAGDVDGDRTVTIYDITRMAYIYNVRWPDPLYDPNCDLDNDGDIDIYDIVIAADNYNKSW